MCILTKDQQIFSELKREIQFSINKIRFELPDISEAVIKTTEEVVLKYYTENLNSSLKPKTLVAVALWYQLNIYYLNNRHSALAKKLGITSLWLKKRYPTYVALLGLKSEKPKQFIPKMYI